MIQIPLDRATFDAWINDPAQGERLWELINGEPVEKMPTQLHAAIAGLVALFIGMYLQQQPIGWVLVEARYRLPDDDRHNLIPDVSFVNYAQGPLIERGAAPYMPLLAVEIESPGQSARSMADKGMYYVNHGTQLVWLIYPAKKLVEVITPTERFFLNADETLTGGETLPGFEVVVGKLFPM